MTIIILNGEWKNSSVRVDTLLDVRFMRGADCAVTGGWGLGVLFDQTEIHQ